MMNTNLTIKNFRVFDSENGGTIKLAPITLLTGCNSSGKSSVVKALLLLKDYFKQTEGGKFTDCKLDFGNTQAKLGRYDIARNNSSSADGKITFTYTIYSHLLGEDIEVVLTFASDEKDVLNNGWLSDILIKKLDGTIFFDAFIDKSVSPNMFKHIAPEALQIRTNNLCAIKNNFFAHVLKCLTIDTLYLCNAFIADEQVERVEDYEEISESLDILAQFIPKNELEQFIQQLNAETKTVTFQALPELYQVSQYNKMEQLFNCAHKYNTLFPMPILEVLSGVNKGNVKESLNCWFDKVNETMKGEPRLTDLNKNTQEFLDKVLTSFEMSEHNTVIEYFVAEEDRWLQDYQLQTDYDHMGEDLNLRKLGDFVKIPRVMNEYTFGHYETFSLDDDATGEPEIVKNFSVKRFGDIFQTLHLVDKYIKPAMTHTYDYMKRNNDSAVWYSEDVHKIFDAFRHYVADVMNEVLSPIVFKTFEYVGDSAIETKRLYTRELGDLFGKVVFDYLETVRTYKPIKDGFEAGSFINKWVKKFELGDHISITSTAEGLGVIVKLHKTPDENGTLLADEGLGITKLIGTLINIELNILHTNGQGITLAIEEPENHLHPKFQSMLAEMFADAFKNYGIHFIVETHSEYMVRKLQTLVARKELTPKEVSLQYFYSPDIELRPQGEPQVKDIPVREDGILLAPFGPGFLDEADNLVTDILTLKAMS